MKRKERDALNKIKYYGWGPNVPEKTMTAAEYEAAHGEKRTGQFKIDFRGSRQWENRWTRYRAPKLRAIGFSEYEILALKYNRLTNPRVAGLLKDIKREVETIRQHFHLKTYADAANYRRDNYDSLVDSGEITESDPYFRMGYIAD